MTVSRDSVRILTTPDSAARFLREVNNAADSDRDALGFFSHGVYYDYCRRGLLFVATVQIADKEAYAGHLLFDLRFPKSHVRQIYVSRDFRGLKIGSALLDALKDQLTARQFISIHARVAEDLQQANAFWESQAFYAQRVTPGGASRNRMIVVRAHELNTPQLFASSGVSASDPLGLNVDTYTSTPLYLLDLNVLFDLGPRRPRFEQAMNVFRAQRMQACSLAVSTEIDNELERSKRDAKTDPMLSLAATFAKFPTPPDSEWEKIFPVLAEMIFPERHASGSLTQNDSSDLKHLATAIHHGVFGLITSDERILNQAASLRSAFGIDVISPELFQVEPDHLSDTASHAAHTENIIEVEIATPNDTAAIQGLLKGLGITSATQVNEWAATDVGSSACVRLVARCNGSIAGYLVCPASFRGVEIKAHVAIAEDQAGAQEVARSLLTRLMDLIKPGEVGHILLRCPPRQAVLREEARLFGYMAFSSAPNTLQKIVVKQRLTTNGWASGSSLLASVSGIKLPNDPPDFRHVDQQIPITRPDGERALVPLFKLETLLAPLLLCPRGREGVMVPIRREFEEHLLAESPQASFLPKSKAQLTPQRHYLSDKKTLKKFIRGDLLFFYETAKNKGAAAVVAVARVVQAYLQNESAMRDEDLAPSVLDHDLLSSIGASSTKTITVFDNLLRLARPVSLTDLKTLQCGAPHQLITAQKLSAEQVQAILEKGL